MVLTENQLRKIISKSIARRRGQQAARVLSEGWLDRFIKGAGDLGGRISGTNKLGEIEANTTEEAWLLFRSVVGPGTDEETIKEVMLRRKDDLSTLDKEFSDLVRYGRKSLELSGKDLNNYNPGKWDLQDFSEATRNGFVYMGVMGVMLQGGGAAWIGLNALGWVLTWMNEVGGKLQNKERKEDRKFYKKNLGLVGKLITKLKGTIEDKSLAQYLRDDGEDEWAEFLEKGIKGQDVPPPTAEETKSESRLEFNKLIFEYIELYTPRQS